MTQQNREPHANSLPTLKTPEPRMDPDNPWSDDLVGRKGLAGLLTAIVRDQAQPLRVSLHGPWGTGKTFLLKRWGQELRNQGFHAIYFSAWEEDFRKDPLVAILGQMYRELQTEPTFKQRLGEIGLVAGKLLWETGVTALRNSTGFDANEVRNILQGENPLEEYTEEGKTRDELKERLETLTENVNEKTGQPLVFIIDELDRCRPDWAMECLERAKHIMEIPGMVFIFGINRQELCKSVRHQHGDIDASTYLQRFFDLELNLPEVKPAEFLRAKLWELGMDVSRGDQLLGNLIGRSPDLMMGIGLSLREIEHCTRTMALALRTLRRDHDINPKLLGVLSIIKVRNPELYRNLIEGKCQNIDVMEWIESLLQGNGGTPTLSMELGEIEIRLANSNQENDPIARDQLNKLLHEQALDHPEAISERLKGMGPKRIETMGDPMRRERYPGRDVPISTLNAIIDLYQNPVP